MKVLTSLNYTIARYNGMKKFIMTIHWDWMQNRAYSFYQVSVSNICCVEIPVSLESCE